MKTLAAVTVLICIFALGYFYTSKTPECAFAKKMSPVAATALSDVFKCSNTPAIERFLLSYLSASVKCSSRTQEELLCSTVAAYALSVSVGAIPEDWGCKLSENAISDVSEQLFKACLKITE